jgi:predicted nucleic acid-binding protein
VAVSWPGGPWVADTSAWARAADPAVSRNWKAAASADELVGCPVVTRELLYDAPDRERVESIALALAGLRQAPINRSVTDAAISALRELAARGSAGAHRVRIPDALVAAAAAERGLGVLHYEEHFECLATVLGFTSRSIVRAGSIA